MDFRGMESISRDLNGLLAQLADRKQLQRQRPEWGGASCRSVKPSDGLGRVISLSESWMSSTLLEGCNKGVLLC